MRTTSLPLSPSLSFVFVIVVPMFVGAGAGRDHVGAKVGIGCSVNGKMLKTRKNDSEHKQKTTSFEKEFRR